VRDGADSWGAVSAVSNRAAFATVRVLSRIGGHVSAMLEGEHGVRPGYFGSVRQPGPGDVVNGAGMPVLPRAALRVLHPAVFTVRGMLAGLGGAPTRISGRAVNGGSGSGRRRVRGDLPPAR
jgi:hypothetical protein